MLTHNQDSVTSVKVSNDEDTIITEKQDELDHHNDLAPSAGTNGVDKSHSESKEPKDNDTDFLEENSVPVSKKSANAPIRKKKVAGLAVLFSRQILKGSQLTKFALQDTNP